MHADDMALLREFARNNSEQAFSTLVARYIDLVHSVALRQVGNAHDAEEITQAVFIILANKAGKLGPKTLLSGWLYQTARLTSSNFRRAAFRRQRRELEACMQFIHESEADGAWQRLSTLIEEAMERLNQHERDAIVLRFFENHTVPEIAATLGLKEAAAQKRVNRATDKLRRFFARRGVQVSAAALIGSLSAHAVQAAPAELASKVAASVAWKGATAGTSILALTKTTLKTMAWTKAKTAVVTGATALLALSLGVGTFTILHNRPPRQTGRLRLPVGPNTPAISFGRSHGVVLASDGSLWVWGENGLGWPALGLGTIPNAYMLTRLGTDNDWREVAAGESHNLAIKADGTLWAWGENVRHELGDELLSGGKFARFRDRPVPSVAGHDWAEVAAGLEDSFGLKKDGSLWAWGLNNFGQLGIGNFERANGPTRVGAARWKKVWAGFVNTAGLQEDGSLWIWGGGPKLGNTDRDPQFSKPVCVSSETNWLDVAVGMNVVFAIRSDGALLVWGRDSRLYLNTNADPAVLTRIGTDSDWRNCSCCGSHYLILTKNDQSVWTMTVPDQSSLAVCKRVPVQKGFQTLAGGAFGTGIGLTSDGEVWTWDRVMGEHTATVRGSGRDAKLIEPERRMTEKPWQLTNVDPNKPTK